MAAIHVLSAQYGEYKVAIHAAVSNTNNSAGVNFRTALINSGLGGTTILPDGDGTAGTIAAAEKTSIQTGAIVEVIGFIRGDTVAAGAALNAYLDAEAARIAAERIVDLARQLKYFGATRG